MSTRRDRVFRATAVKLGVFAVVMILVFVGLVVVFSQYRSGSTDDYSATFTSASQMKSGSTVRIAGVRVGTVHGVSLNRDNTAEVSFDVDSADRLPTSVQAYIRYENLTGDRYLELAQGTGDPDRLLPTGAHIPIGQTEPALDLDTLLGGFKPLFATLKGNEVTELSESLVQIFQGQGPALSRLLSQTASLTSTLGDRDELIGRVITNLNSTLKTLSDDKQGLDTSLDRLQQLISGLDSQRGTIGSAISSTAGLTNDLAGLLDTNRPNLRTAVERTGQVSQQVLDDEPYIRGVISRLPENYRILSNIGDYGGWLQLWLCQINLYITGPNHEEIVYRANDAINNRTNPGSRCDKR